MKNISFLGLNLFAEEQPVDILNIEKKKIENYSSNYINYDEIYSENKI